MKKVLRAAPSLPKWLGALWLSLSWLIGYSAPGDIKIEAEAATLNGVQIVSTTPGYSGTGYAWNFDNAADNVVFSFPATAGEYELSIIYYSPYGEKGYGLQVNSATSSNMFTSTGTGFGSAKPGKFVLNAGQNTITITNGWGYYGIDYILLTPVATAPPPVAPVVNGRVEAEAGVLNGVVSSTSPAGYSGTGYVTSFDNATDNVTMSFTATAGLYALSVRYTSPFGPKGFDFQVNEERGSGMFAATSATEFSTANAGNFLLKQGLNTITINRGWGYFGIDYIQLTSTTAPLPIKPPKTLVDAQATPSTRSLFSYIVDQYGSKVISGQHDDVDYIFQQTGKEPAIRSFDLIEYSPSRIQYGSNPRGKTEECIAWAKKNEGRGIPSVMWHWNAPADLINLPPDRLWWSGFYTRATTFDLAAVLADKNGDRYNLLLRDIDAIAVELKKFRDADIPVLWRPLHEAPGGWFWWGAKGPEPLKELWRMMYERLTNYHQLHNLIWVYTGTDQLAMNWYPGDQYVDMVGLDIYTDPTANLSGNWNNTLSSFNGKKLVALTEVGNLPNPDKVRGFGTWWSWFSVWTGNDYIKKQPLDLLKAVYNDVDVITRDELPDWRTYGQVQLTAPTYNCQTGAITFRTTSGDGSPVEFMAVGVKGWSTDSTGVVDAALRNDPKPVQLLARQGGRTVSYIFDLPAACPGTVQPGAAFALRAPLYNCQTGAITFRTTGGNGSPVEFMAIGVKGWSTDSTGVVEAGLRNDQKTIELLARQNGVTVRYGFDLRVACSQIPTEPITPPATLTLLPPTYNCATGAITFKTAGGNGTPIEFMAVGVKGWSVNPNGIVEAGLRSDPSSIELMARQSGIIVRYQFDLRNACNTGARLAALAAESSDAQLRVKLLGNPAQRELRAEITGSAGQSLRVVLTDMQGRQLYVRQIEQAEAVEQIAIPVGDQPAGLLLLRASTNTQTQSVKVLKQ